MIIVISHYWCPDAYLVTMVMVTMMVIVVVVMMMIIIIIIGRSGMYLLPLSFQALRGLPLMSKIVWH